MISSFLTSSFMQGVNMFSWNLYLKQWYSNSYLLINFLLRNDERFLNVHSTRSSLVVKHLQYSHDQLSSHHVEYWNWIQNDLAVVDDIKQQQDTQLKQQVSDSLLCGQGKPEVIQQCYLLLKVFNQFMKYNLWNKICQSDKSPKLPKGGFTQ